MPKAKTSYTCTECGINSSKWAGQCSGCGSWNTTVEMKIVKTSISSEVVTTLESLPDNVDFRYETGFKEFDHVLGGGLIPGSVILLGGDPGIGKSTLLQQVSANLMQKVPICYASGEESLRQIGQRSHRLGLDALSMNILTDSSILNVLSEAKKCDAHVLIVDSMQTMTNEDLSSAPGSIAQLRECVAKIVEFAKKNDVTVFIIGHVTKEGAIAGPRVVEHMVDTVLYFESDPASRYSIIRSVKNRFGASGEMGVFAMTDKGFSEVRNPSAIFLSRGIFDESGNIVSIIWEGSRPLLVEIQALVSQSNNNHTRRLAQGVDQNRLALLIAVLQRHGSLSLVNEDVFINVVSGLKINETAVDLPIIMAIVSSLKNLKIAEDFVCFGEVGLAGEIRPVRYGIERITAAIKQGFSKVIVPKGNVPKKIPKGIEIIGVRRLSEAIEVII